MLGKTLQYEVVKAIKPITVITMDSWKQTKSHILLWYRRRVARGDPMLIRDQQLGEGLAWQV